MSDSMDRLAQGLYDALKNSEKRETKPYDTTGEVVRIEGEKVYVKFSGGENPTPVNRTVDAKVGDTVLIRVSSKQAWIVGNSTAPPTDDTVATAARNTANTAIIHADYAEMEAGRAHDAADKAAISADIARIAAGDAQASAITANIASNSALTQLSVVEDVASVLQWISEHGTYKLTTDPVKVDGKLYFVRSGTEESGYEYDLVTDPESNPVEAGYYELDTIGDETVANYISSHLALTNAGLWVLKDNSSYKVLLSNSGMNIYDNYGNLVVTYGDNITFNNTRSFYVGNSNAYILFDPTNGGSITIGGHNVNLGSNKTLEELLAEINGMFTFDTSYVIENRTINNELHKIAVFTAHLYRNGVDIKETQTSGGDYIYPASRFTWYLKHENSQTQEGDYLGSGYTMEIDLNQCNFGAEVIAKYTTTEDSPLLDGDDNNLTTSDDTPITGRTESGESVRVRDLTVTTTLMPSDKLLIVGAEEEQIATIETVANTLWEMYGVTIENEPLQQGNNNYEDIGLLSLTNIELEAMLA